jgi:BASS family bile acid:Na+ symporter
MFELLIKISNWVLPVFVFCTMFNVGLTQKLGRIVEYYKEWRFFMRLLLANFILVPLAMLLLLSFTDFDRSLQIGLIIFSLTAGAPFLIKLTQNSKHDIALGVSLLLLLIVGTVVFVPMLLPRFIPGLEVDAGSITLNLAKSLILPIALGMALAYALPNIARKIQPWMARVGNYALYILLIATLIGYFPRLKDILGTGAILVGIVFVLLAFGIGFVQTSSRDLDSVQDVGALGTAQRNTAASMIIATANFSDNPNVLLIITIANTLGIILLLGLATFLSRDNKFEIVVNNKHLENEQTAGAAP